MGTDMSLRWERRPPAGVVQLMRAQFLRGGGRTDADSISLVDARGAKNALPFA
jgi:hypothetical protein